MIDNPRGKTIINLKRKGIHHGSCKLVRDGFKLHDTYGFPLILQLHQCEIQRVIVSLPDFYVDAVKAGWKDTKIRSTIREAVMDAKGRKGVELIDENLDRFLWALGPKPDEDRREWAKSMKKSLDWYWAQHTEG